MDFRRPLQTVAPTLDGDVLAVLAHSDAEMTGRQIHRLAGRGSHQGIRNAVDRLAAQGVVLRRSLGGAHMYRLNRDHLAAPWIEGLADLSTQLVERLRVAVERWTRRPVAVVLFGSVAAGRATSESDLDLLVVRPEGCDPDAPEWCDQLADLEERATAWSGNEARVIEYGEDEIGRGAAEPFLQTALSDGIALYGRQSAVRRLARDAGLR